MEPPAIIFFVAALALAIVGIVTGDILWFVRAVIVTIGGFATDWFIKKKGKKIIPTS